MSVLMWFFSFMYNLDIQVILCDFGGKMILWIKDDLDVDQILVLNFPQYLLTLKCTFASLKILKNAIAWYVVLSLLTKIYMSQCDHVK